MDIGADNQTRTTADQLSQDLRNPSSTPAVTARTNLRQVGATRFALQETRRLIVPRCRAGGGKQKQCGPKDSCLADRDQA